MQGYKRKTIDVWISLHTPDKARNDRREVSVSIHSEPIADENRPTKILGPSSICLIGHEDLFLLQLDIDPSLPLFVHVVAILNSINESGEKITDTQYIGYCNLEVELGFRGQELLIDVANFQLYSLCRPAPDDHARLPDGRAA